MFWYDTETCGLHGPIVLMQYSPELDGPVTLHHVWVRPIRETLHLIEKLLDAGTIGFNIAFDHFHLSQTYNVLRLCENLSEPPNREEYAALESKARDGLCLKPRHALDLMCVARRGKYQVTMDRKPINIRKVPIFMADRLVSVLNEKIKISNLLFSNKVNKHERWKIKPIEKEPGWCHLSLEFAPSARLKALMTEIKGEEVADYDPSSVPQPVECGYAPYNDVVPDYENWLVVLKQHVNYWRFNTLGQEYATNDIIYLYELYKHLGSPPPDDDDSVLACLVGTVRWRGFSIDSDAITKLRDETKSRLITEFNFNSRAVVKRYLYSVLKPEERANVSSTGKKVLEELTKWTGATVCDDCFGEGCITCGMTGEISDGIPHPVAERAQRVLDSRTADKTINLYDKLLKAGRLHASFKVIGTLSGRMSGSDDMNPQGINKDARVRKCFTLKWPGTVLCGGDFDSFEVGIMCAVYNDPALNADLLSGKKIHGLFGSFLYGKSYEEIIATAELPAAHNLYGRAKNCVFAVGYGADVPKIAETAGISHDAAAAGYKRWVERYVVWGKARQRIFDKFCSMRQPKGIGSRVEWHEPAEYAESMYGFRRYFTLENRICHTLFQLANQPPLSLKESRRVTRRDREQSAQGACQSALYAAAFNVQANNMRAAANHEIQSTGANLTKRLQCLLWELQPVGAGPWLIQPMNVHDELPAVCDPSIVPATVDVVNQFLEKYRKDVPLLNIGWKTNKENWCEIK